MTDRFKTKVLDDNTFSETLKWLANEPNYNVLCWSRYNINKFSFCTKSQDDKSTMQNSEVMIMAFAMLFSSSKDKNFVLASIAYFGVIEEIWELDYSKFKVPVFKCKWVNSNNGVQIDEFGYTLLDLDKVGYRDEHFIMAAHARQIFYVKDPSNNMWLVVLQRKNMHLSDENDDSTLDIDDTNFSTQRPSFTNDNEVYDVYATHHDHHEGILEDNK